MSVGDENLKKRPFNVCIPTGSILFPNTAKESALVPYGIGIAIYFKYLKYLIYLFLLLFILNIPVLFILTLNKKTVIDNYSSSWLSSQLFSATFGNIGEGHPACSKISFDENDSNKQQLNLQCEDNMRIIDLVGTAYRSYSDDSSICLIPKS